VIELLFALVMVAVAMGMIWGARKRSRKGKLPAREPRVGEPHSTIDPHDVVSGARSSASMARRSRGADGDGHADGAADGSGNGGD
jgi:hypothetical protein